MKKRITLSAHQMLFFMSYVCISFNVVLMQNKGLSNTTIGTILAVTAVISIVMQPVWGFVSDWIQSTRKIFILCTGLSAVCYCMLAFSDSAVAVGLIFPLFSIFSCVLVSLVNTRILTSISGGSSITYGSIALWGSIGYAVMAYIIGQHLGKGFSINILFPVYVIFAAANITLAFFMKDDKTVKKRARLKDMRVGMLFKNYYYVTFLIFILIAYIPISASFGYFVNVVTSLGGTTETTGTIYALRAIAEIPFFIFAQQLIKKVGTRMVLIISAISFFCIFLAYGLADRLIVALVAHVFQGPAYSLLLTAMLNYVFELSPQNLRTTAQTILTATQTGLGSMIGNFLTGRLTDLVGVSMTYRYASCIIAFSIVFFLLTLYIGKKLNIPLIPVTGEPAAVT